MILLTLIYALCFTAIKAGLPYLPPLLFGGLRMLLGGLALIMVAGLLKQSLLPTKYEWKWILWIGLATAVTYFGMFLSPGRTGAGIASILGNMSPLFTVLLAAAVLHEKFSRSTSIALLLGVGGVIFISYPDVFAKNTYGIVGFALALAASSGSAASNILVKLIRKQYEVIRVSAWQLIVGSLPLLLISLITEQGQPFILNGTSLGILLFLGLIGTGGVTAAWYMLIQRHSIVKLSLFLFLIPVFGLVIAGFAFKETMRTNELLGIGFILLATLFIVIDSMRVRSVQS